MGHTQCVSSVVWPEYGKIYSASWDHSIRRWDIETGKDTINMVLYNYYYYIGLISKKDVIF